jgi:polyphosphate kinase 2
MDSAPIEAIVGANFTSRMTLPSSKSCHLLAVGDRYISRRADNECGTVMLMAGAETEWNRPPLGALDVETRRLDKRGYEREIARLQVELVRLQDWVLHRRMKVVVVFEGRDTAGKGGTIKRITEKTNPRVVRTVALGTPTERERTQWYFQRYVAHLPAAGEIVLFDRSWYNRAGVERVMGFCTQAEYEEFMRTCPQFERDLLHSGIILIKYWLSVSDEEQERRFKARLKDPAKQWKLSGMDLEARRRWVDYAEAKDDMFAYTDTHESPWYVVEADDKRTMRLNLISHLLSLIPYEELPREKITLPERQSRAYVRPPQGEQNYVPTRYHVG